MATVQPNPSRTQDRAQVMAAVQPISHSSHRPGALVLGALAPRALALATVTVALLMSAGCKSSRPAPDSDVPAITAPFTDDFERSVIGDDYRDTDGHAYSLANGSLRAHGAHNHPLWLRRRIPERAVIELDVWSQSRDGDIKVEVAGDGVSFDPDRGAYTSTGYVVIMGGWHNSKSIIARQYEHGKDVVERTAPRVAIGQRYHWKIVRNGHGIVWYVDDMDHPFLQLEDSDPLTGAGHDHLGFDDWEADVYFDNLSIRPL